MKITLILEIKTYACNKMKHHQITIAMTMFYQTYLTDVTSNYAAHIIHWNTPGESDGRMIKTQTMHAEQLGFEPVWDFSNQSTATP